MLITLTLTEIIKMEKLAECVNRWRGLFYLSLGGVIAGLALRFVTWPSLPSSILFVLSCALAVVSFPIWCVNRTESLRYIKLVKELGLQRKVENTGAQVGAATFGKGGANG